MIYLAKEKIIEAMFDSMIVSDSQISGSAPQQSVTSHTDLLIIARQMMIRCCLSPPPLPPT